jgi:hypothetical protein
MSLSHSASAWGEASPYAAEVIAPMLENYGLQLRRLAAVSRKIRASAELPSSYTVLVRSLYALRTLAYFNKKVKNRS